MRKAAQNALIYLEQYKIAKQHWFGVVGASGCKFTPHLLGTPLWVGFGQIYGGPTFRVLCLALTKSRPPGGRIYAFGLNNPQSGTPQSGASLADWM